MNLNVDIVNGLFELGGAYCTWRNALQLYRDKEVKGVYWPLTLFFAIWGVWNLFYYPALGQWFSFAAGAALVVGNILWVVQAVRLLQHDTTPLWRVVVYGAYCFATRRSWFRLAGWLYDALRERPVQAAAGVTEIEGDLVAIDGVPLPLVEIVTELRLAPGRPHRFWETGDEGVPSVILDRDGAVTLGLCRDCGQAEADLEESCPGVRS